MVRPSTFTTPPSAPSPEVQIPSSDNLPTQSRPTVVVHCAANRSPDLVDADPSAARTLNVTSTATLARLTSARKILLLYISTDYVFPGRPGESPYSPTSPTAPPNLYGQTKLDGEDAVLSATHDSPGLGVALRVPVLYGHAASDNESAINVLIDAVYKAQESESPVTMDDWALRYPTNTEDVGRVCVDVAEKYLSTPDAEKAALPRVLQFSSEDRYTKYEVCKVFAEILGLPLDGMVANKKGNDPTPGSVQRPYDTHLSTKELRELGVDVWTQDFVAWW